MLLLCAARTNSSWMLDNDTNKCIDKKTKAIHSCSPYCLAIKKTNLENGENFKKRKSEGKPVVYDSLSSYFEEAKRMVESENEESNLEAFMNLVNSKSRIHNYLAQIEEYDKIKDNEYVIFYADLPTQIYQKAYRIYMLDKIFTTNQYNFPRGEVYFKAYDSKTPVVRKPEYVQGIASISRQAIYAIEVSNTVTGTREEYYSTVRTVVLNQATI